MGIASNTVRGADRKRVLMKARIVTSDGPQHVRVRDLTASGARICVNTRLHADSDIIFERGTLFVAARVVWSRPEEAGIEFYRELEMPSLNSMFNPVFEIG